jgi:hypothetical protein
MKYLLAKIIKWKKEKSVKYNTHNRNSECSSQLFDAIYDNNFELAKNLIDGGKVDVNIKNDCGRGDKIKWKTSRTGLGSFQIIYLSKTVQEYVLLIIM